MSDSLHPHGLRHTRLPCPSPIPGVHLNTCPSSRGCHPAISSSVVPFSSCPQSFPESGIFQMSQFFTPGSQSIGVSASTSVLSMNTQDWSPLRWIGWISLQSKGLSRVFSTTVQKHQFFSTQLSFFFFIFKLYIIVLVLPNIKMNLPHVYMCSPSWTLLPPPSPFHPSAFFTSQSNSHLHPWLDGPLLTK